MVERALAPDAAAPLPASATTAVAWRTDGQLYITVIAKATFAFAPDTDMPRIEPQAILPAEVYHGGNPARSVRFSSDIAPHLGRADVLFTGYACAPPPGPAHGMHARLAIFRGEAAILDKTILVQDARGFQHLPIVYEQAYGGAGVAENPLGVGETAESGAPLFLDPQHPQHPTGFGPIARAWPVRRRLLGATPRKSLEGPIAEIPHGFDWSYFQAAPLDQRTDFLHGDEWIVLAGLHPELPLLRMRLPGARGVARIHGLSTFGVPEGQALELNADTLRIQGEDQRCTLVCRRSFPVASEAALAAVRIVAGIQIAGEAIPWFEPQARAVKTLDLAEPTGEVAQTLALSPASAAELLRPALPFGPADLTATMVLSPEPESPLTPPPLPFSGASGAAVAPMPRPLNDAPEHVATGTLVFTPTNEDTFKASLPWERRPPVAEAHAPPTPVLPEPTPDLPEPSFTAPEQETVPYFVPQAPTPAVTATPPLPEPPATPEALLLAPAPPLGDVPLARFAALAAEIAEKRTPRPELLLTHDLDEEAWSATESHWKAAIKKDATEGAGKLQGDYDSAYVAAVEGFRGPITAEEYAQLVVGLERKQANQVLDRLGIQRPASMILLRLWTKKVAADPKLFNEFSAARAALRT